MPHGTKIATCCYCGTRAALVLRGKDRHELSCAACGAPLHEMKSLPVAAGARAPGKGKTVNRSDGPDVPLPVWARAHPEGRPVKRKKKSRRKKAWDLLEDVFDAVGDIFD